METQTGFKILSGKYRRNGDSFMMTTEGEMLYETVAEHFGIKGSALDSRLFRVNGDFTHPSVNKIRQRKAPEATEATTKEQALPSVGLQQAAYQPGLYNQLFLAVVNGLVVGRETNISEKDVLEIGRAAVRISRGVFDELVADFLEDELCEGDEGSSQLPLF